MGIVFIMFAELWVTFFQTYAELCVKIFNRNCTSPFKIRLRLIGMATSFLYILMTLLKFISFLKAFR